MLFKSPPMAKIMIYVDKLVDLLLLKRNYLKVELVNFKSR